MNVISIIEGNLRKVFNIRTPIMKYREENYCKKCPLAYAIDGRYTGICNKSEGGCGCGVTAKTSQNLQGCPKGFWGSNWFKPELFIEYLKDNHI